MERKKKSELFLEVWNKYKYVALVVLLGVILLVWPSGKKSGESQSAGVQAGTAKTESLADTEKQMEEILSQIDGAGKLSLMLTVESSGGEQYAQDTELSYSGSVSAPEDYSRKSTTVVTSTGQGDSPVVTQSAGPVYRGALVVCQGADHAGVKLAVTQAVAALTGLSSDRITVVKCQ
ncbi:MAG: stage III sporulation protein AG [Oscillibacter sp.]|jgi:stage III sporulation protein AG|nr:stage III sporulation protein AG [Oscillibacter sp.]